MIMDLKALFKRDLLKNAAIYTITDGISKSISFLLLPVVSYFLVPEEIGLVANFDVLQSVIMLISGQAIVNSLPYFYYKLSKEEVALLVSNLLFIIIAINLFFSIVILIFNPIIEKYLQLVLPLQALTILSVLSSLLIAINMVLLRLEDKPYRFAKLQIIQTLLNISLVVLLVIILRWGAVGKICATVFSLVIMALFHLYLLIKRRYITRILDKVSLKVLLKFGIPLLPHSLSFWIKSGMDKVLLTNFCGLSINGLYSMAMSLGAIFSIFTTAFNNAYIPFLQKRITAVIPETKDREEKFFVSITYKLIACFSLLCVCAIFFSWIVISYILDDRYKSSFEFVPWIMISLTITSFYGLVVQFVYTKKKTLGLGVITFLGSVVQLCLTYVFIQIWGKDGIKYSLVIGSLLIMLGVWFYSNKVFPLPWFKKMW